MAQKMEIENFLNLRIFEKGLSPKITLKQDECEKYGRKINQYELDYLTVSPSTFAFRILF